MGYVRVLVQSITIQTCSISRLEQKIVWERGFSPGSSKLDQFSGKEQ